MKNFRNTLRLIEEKISYYESVVAGKEPYVEVKAEPYVCPMKTQDLVSLFYKADLRVGNINNAKKHPESEKLYIEEIDMGKGEVRQILSGLQQFYSVD